MPHVVTQACCGDASCVYACPVNCIHPTPDEPGFATSEMLYVDPSSCVDCGACVSACPVGAIVPLHRLLPTQARFTEVNADHYRTDQTRTGPTPQSTFPVDAVRRPLAPIDKPRPIQIDGKVSIGIVGSGPSAMYAADDLLRHRQVRITMYERLDRPFGLARFGVAPDHTSTRRVMDLFDETARDRRLEILVNTEVGRDISLPDVRARHDAVIWAGGAPTDRPLEIPGIDADGVHSATSVVGWYNGHPDHVGIDIDLATTDRAVIVGNGNVALDVARILTADPDRLADTDISRPALAALRSSAIEEVVVIGRRGPAHAAFTLPELIGLVDGGANVVVAADDVAAARDGVPDDADEVTRAKLDLLDEVARRPARPGPRIRFAFFRAPRAVVVGAAGAATAVELGINEPGETGGTVVATGDTETLDAGLVLTSIGYRGVAVDGLPFDAERAVIPHVRGRVVGPAGPVDGIYVTGWIKRGPSGFIGTNKTDSEETVRTMIGDLESGRLAQRRGSRRRLLGSAR